MAVLRARVGTASREDWILGQVDRGINLPITKPERVKTELDCLSFPPIAFLQTGSNVYTFSWHCGASGRNILLQLMVKKIPATQSTPGDKPC